MTARDTKLQARGTKANQQAHPAAGAIGKRTLVQLAPAGAPPQHEQIHQTARAAVAGPAAAMPHAALLQQLFGRHDISGIQAHSDATAAAGAGAIGAQAFTLGDHVAFAGTPSLHTAAHEAAHVVQQRAGVNLGAGGGERGDAYERHADAVADQVVAGRSAEALLDTMAPAGGTGAGTAAVQCEWTVVRFPGNPDKELRITFRDSYFTVLEPTGDEEEDSAHEDALIRLFSHALDAFAITPLVAATFVEPTSIEHAGNTFIAQWSEDEQRLYVSKITRTAPVKRKRKLELGENNDGEQMTPSSKKQLETFERSESDDREREDEPQPTRDELLAPYRYGGRIFDAAPKDSEWIACHYTSPEAIPKIQDSGIVISKELNGTGAAIGKVNQDGEGFYTTTDKKWPYLSPEKSQVQFAVYIHPAVKQYLRMTRLPSHLSFSKDWWQDDEQLSRYITDFDVIERPAGSKQDLKFNPHAVPYLALVFVGQRDADPNFVRLREENGFGLSNSTPKPVQSGELTSQQIEVVTQMFTSEAYRSADPGRQLEMRQQLAKDLGVRQALFAPFREQYEK